MERKGRVPKEITSAKVTVKELEEDQLIHVRESLVKASKVRDATDMWYLVRDILNLLTLILYPEVPKEEKSEYPYKPGKG